MKSHFSFSETLKQEAFPLLDQVSLSIKDTVEQCKVFNKYRIMPYECDKASNSLLNLCDLIKEFRYLFIPDNSQDFQTLLMLLYNVEYLTKAINKPIRQLRLICLEASEQKFEFKADIQFLVDDFLDTQNLIDVEIKKLYEIKRFSTLLPPHTFYPDRTSYVTPSA